MSSGRCVLLVHDLSVLKLFGTQVLVKVLSGDIKLGIEIEGGDNMKFVCKLHNVPLIGEPIWDEDPVGVWEIDFSHLECPENDDDGICGESHEFVID